MSSTQRHPESFLARRMEEVGADSNTNPHPEDYVAARLANIADENTEDVRRRSVVVHDDSLKKPCKQPVKEPTNIRALPIESISFAARVIFSPSVPLANWSSNDDDLVPVAGDCNGIYMVLQSSDKASFKLTSDQLSFEIYYEPGSDNLAFVNRNKTLLWLASIKEDNTSGHQTMVAPYPAIPFVVTPGPWRISSISAGQQRETLGDFLLLRRRYDVTIGKMSHGQSGTKRGLESVAESVKKRQFTDDQSLLLIQTIPNKELSTEMTLVHDEHPLSQLQAGQILTIQSPTPAFPSSPSTKNSTSSESYSLSNMRNIVKSRSNAAVFLGHHSLLGRIAVKVIQSADYASNLIPRLARTFENEMKLLKRANHPSIIKFKGSDARLFSIYMEYLPHRDLAGWSYRPDHFFEGTAADASRVLSGIASALSHLHKHRIFHNDIKPGNILFDRARGPVLIDFGLASFDEKTPTGGTPWYIPREFMTGANRGAKGDVFALGVTMLYLLRKTCLPEKGTVWDIFKVKDAGTDFRTMDKWLNAVVKMRSALRGNEVELVVSEMLNEIAAERISADNIISRIPKQD